MTRPPQRRDSSQSQDFWYVAPLVIGIAFLLTKCSGEHLWSSQAAAAPESNLTAEIEKVGGLPFSAEIKNKLQTAWAARPTDYTPRTKHLNADGSPKYINRLFLESSPYLRQHAHNPVNWYPWGDEAFAEAKRLGRPVLLSVGYSTCHWCHVMEEESFEDEEIARFLNANYVAIKVDREERPDIDAIYMAAVQALTGGGGWPMTVWLTAERKPYYGATYIPARDGDRGATNGFLTIIEKLADVYRTRRGEVDQNVAALVEKVNQSLAPPAGAELPEAAALRGTASFYDRQYDSIDGGTKGAPKFPSNLSIRFLLRYHRRTGEAKYLEMATQTLERMARGGIYDQVGGGFHRYSTDAQWLVPHFEKMLYDNALLAVAYLEAYQATGREDFAATVREILRYVERDMTSPEGAFYSATDADSPNPEGEREEGWFFTWTPAELEAVLGKERARIVAAYYGVTEKGNFEGRSILHRAKPVERTLAELKLSGEEIEALLTPPSRSTDSAADAFRRLVQQCNEQLYIARQKRPAPLRDEKILTSWNGLMISAHAFAALVLDEPDFARRAERAAAFLLENSRRDGRLLRSYKDGQARHNAYLDDYAFLTAGLIDLYEATGEPRWLREAIALDRVLESQYEDQTNGGFFLTSNDHEKLLAREKPSYDGAEPSGNSVAVLNLLRLHEFTTDDRYRQRAERAMAALSPLLRRAPWGMTEMLLALDYHLDTPKEILIIAPENGIRADARPFLDKIADAFVPNRVIAVVRQGDELIRHAEFIPLLEDKRAIRGETTAYVCEQRVCELPTGDPEVFARQISKTRPLPSPEAQ